MSKTRDRYWRYIRTMRQFIKFTFASCLGVLIAMGVFIGFLAVLVSSASMSTKKKVTSDSVLEIALDYSPPEITNNIASSPLSLNTGDIIGLQDIVKQIRRAADDDRIKGIYFDPTMMSLNASSASLLANEFDAFRAKGKFVLTYSNFFSQGGYYLAAASDTIIMNPIGSVDFRGFSSVIPFFKDVLDKSGIKMQIYYSGKFKSATEPFRRSEMSPENRFQTKEFLEETYSSFLTDIGARRDLSTSRLREIADKMLSVNADDALMLGLVDQIGYQDQAHDWMRSRLDIGKKKKVPFVSIKDYYGSRTPKATGASDRIAVVTCEGNIVHSKEEYGVISDGNFVDVLSGIRQKKSVKAVVLRVNSPGGNILAAENILREIQLLQQEDIPVVVSMGDYAASGGYYISCTADSIFAAPNTLTGSIGVFTMIPNPQELITEKIGIGFDTVRTAKYSASFTPFYEWSEEEHAMFKQRTDEFYELFLEKVANGRSMSTAEVDEIAQGRVWTGNKALELGLVDQLGGLDDAIEAAASLAGLDKYRISNYPRLQDPMTRLINELSQGNAEVTADRYFDAKIRNAVPHYDALKSMISVREPMMQLPVIVEMD